MSRTIICQIAVLAASFAFALGSSAADAAEAQELEGVVVSAAMGKLVMTDTDGKQHTHAANEMTKVTIHGKPASLEALKPGMRIRATLDEQNKLLAVATIDDVKAAQRSGWQAGSALARSCFPLKVIANSSASYDPLRF